jgi:hypothetical protein
MIEILENPKLHFRFSRINAFWGLIDPRRFPNTKCGVGKWGSVPYL